MRTTSVKPSLFVRQRSENARTFADALGDDGRPSLDAPSDDDLGGRRADLRCDLLDDGVLSQERLALL